MTSQQREAGVLGRVHQDLKSGLITRRAFVAKATALGVALPVALFIVNSTVAEDAAAQSATPTSSGSKPHSTRPAVGTAHQQRGAGGELKILQNQAPSNLSIHAASGGKDIAAASLVTEPLLSYAPDGTLLPTLVAEVPSVGNGRLSADLKSVTYKLMPNVHWSDGQPFTADDVRFTWQWVVDKANQSIDATTFAIIDDVEVVDPLTARVTFTEPTLAWYIPFTSTNRGGIYPKHYWDGKDPKAANQAFSQKPIGTGPYVVDSFKPNDQVIYVANGNYREPTKPFFARVNLKGGGDMTSAARAVLQTGDWDLSDNAEIEPAVLAQLEKGGKGKVYISPGPYIEKIELNLSDPNKEVDGQRSQKDTPHPFFSDPAVRAALSLATDRETISTKLYSGPPGEPPAKNILMGVAAFESPHTGWEFDVEKAKQVLDRAGWTVQGGVRAKDGIRLKLEFVTTVNPVRQKTQAILKQAWEQAGFSVRLKQVEGSVFFDSSVGNDQNFTHFYADVQEYTDGPTSTFPLSYMQYWYAGPNGANIAQQANNWTGTNKTRYHSARYDALFEQLTRETDARNAADLFVQLNDLVIGDVVEIPLVQVATAKFAAVNNLRYENIAESSFETLYWNIANWNRVT